MSPEEITIFGTAGFTAIFIIGACAITALTLGFIAVSWVVGIKIRDRMFKGDPTIREQGISATAKVLQIGQTGMMVNYQPQAHLVLEVTPPDGEPYQAQVTTVIPMVAIPQFQPGAVVPVKIHPTDRSKVIIDIYK
jgi:hypothetical protein